MELPDDTLLIENSTKRMPDIRVRIIFYIFCCNAIFSMAAMLLGAIPYFYYLGLHYTHNGLLISLSVWAVCLLGLAFCTSRKYWIAAIVFGNVMWIAISGVVGFLSATIYNMSPLQFVGIFWAQSISMIMYTVQSPHNVEKHMCVILLVGATIVALALSIYTFTVEHDWISVAVLCVLSLALGAYNLLVIHRTENRYDASWEQAVCAMSHYYCFDLIELLGA